MFWRRWAEYGSGKGGSGGDVVTEREVWLQLKGRCSLCVPMACVINAQLISTSTNNPITACSYYHHLQSLFLHASILPITIPPCIHTSNLYSSMHPYFQSLFLHASILPISISSCIHTSNVYSFMHPYFQFPFLHASILPISIPPCIHTSNLYVLISQSFSSQFLIIDAFIHTILYAQLVHQ